MLRTYLSSPMFGFGDPGVRSSEQFEEWCEFWGWRASPVSVVGGHRFNAFLTQRARKPQGASHGSTRVQFSTQPIAYALQLPPDAPADVYAVVPVLAVDDPSSLVRADVPMRINASASPAAVKVRRGRKGLGGGSRCAAPFYLHPPPPPSRRRLAGDVAPAAC